MTEVDTYGDGDAYCTECDWTIEVWGPGDEEDEEDEEDGV